MVMQFKIYCPQNHNHNGDYFKGQTVIIKDILRLGSKPAGIKGRHKDTGAVEKGIDGFYAV